MNTAAGGSQHLQRLHRLHLDLQQVHEELERGPRQVRLRAQHLQRHQEDLDRLREEFTELRKAADRKSLQLKTNEAKIDDLRVKLNAAGSNREYGLLRSQIDADTMANSVLEDEILECLDKVDQGQAAIREKEQACEAAAAEKERLAAEVAAAEGGLREKAEALQADISQAERELPDRILATYRRLVNAHGAGALAAVENGACTACYVGLSPQSRVELNSGKIVFCKSCGRLLYPAESE